MLIWIIKSGVPLVFQSFFETPVKEKLLSGFISALNSLALYEFEQPIYENGVEIPVVNNPLLFE